MSTSISRRKSEMMVHVVGAGTMGLLTALMILRLARFYGLSFTVMVYERFRIGGNPADELAAGVRCQAWAHAGSLYAFTQPEVAMTLHSSIRQLRRLVPTAFQSQIPALALLPPKLEHSDVPYEEVARALGIRFDPISNSVASHLAPTLRNVLNSDSRVFVTNESVFNVRLLNAGLEQKVRRAGGNIVVSNVTNLTRTGDRISRLVLENGVVEVAPDDAVVLACSSRIPGLLENVVTKQPVQLVRCQLVATTEIDQRVLLAEVMGGPTAVPHELGRQLFTILGNAQRKDIGAPYDEEAMIDEVLKNASESFGIEPSRDAVRTWTGVKAEVIPPGSDHCQSHFVGPVEELQGSYIAIPGKLSGTPAAASALATQLVRNRLDVGCSIWEEPRLAWDRRTRRRLAPEPQ